MQDQQATLYAPGVNALQQPLCALLAKHEVAQTASTPAAGSRKRKSTVPERIQSLDGLFNLQDSQGQLQIPEFKRAHLMEMVQPPAAAAALKSIFLPLGLPCGVLGVISNNYTFGCQTETALDLSMKTKKKSEETLLPSPSKSPSLTQQQQQQQRQNFSSNQNDHLLRWFIQHRDRPYPGAEDTKTLALATGLTYSQVKKWFANKRMRSKTSSGAQAENDTSACDNKVDLPSLAVTPGDASSTRTSSAELDRVGEPLGIELP